MDPVTLGMAKADAKKKYASIKSKLLVPGAPFARNVMASPPTVALGTTSGITGARGFTASPTSPFMTMCAGGNFLANTGSPFGYSACHVYPQTASGRRYFRTIVGFDGTTIAFCVTDAPGSSYRIRVDGQYVATGDTQGLGGGITRYITITFASAAVRKIELEVVSMDLVSVLVGPTDTVWGIPPRGPRTIIVGDSYTGGSGTTPSGYSGLTSWASAFADTLGWEDVWNSGIGGTGWINRNSGLINNYEDRVAADIVAFNPDVVVFMGGRNDYPNGASLVGQAAGRTLQATRAGLPKALLVVTGPNGSASPTNGSADSTWGAFQAAIFNAVAPYADLTLDYSNSGIFTGTGKAGSTTGVGNGDLYMQSDGVHPTGAGAAYLGQRMGHKMIENLRRIMQ